MMAAAGGCFDLNNPLDCHPSCPAGSRCVNQRCAPVDAGADAQVPCPVGKAGAYCSVCEVGYTSVQCNACSREYVKVKVGTKTRCELSLTATCNATHSWLISGILPPLKRAGATHFSPGGTASQPLVKDLWTGFSWRRCTEGQTWTGGACKGTPKGYPRDAQLMLPATVCMDTYASYSDWRVPEQDELEQLISYDRHAPAMDKAAFPGLPQDWHWTATVGAGSWYGNREAKVHLASGTVGLMSTSVESLNDEYGQVLCVRGTRPKITRRWKVEAQDGSSVRDLWTGIVWQRCAHGQTWEPSKAFCSGSPQEASWASAVTACKSPWRLPSVRELAAMRKYCGERPPINRAAFPAPQTSKWYWSFTSLASDTTRAWAVGMAGTDLGPKAKASDKLFVFCVR